MTEISFYEKYLYSLLDRAKKNKAELITCIVTGFISYGFSFTNKLIQQDDVAAMFAKGTSLTAGRWGLELTSLIFPDVSMPWIYGIISLLLLGISACILINIFNIRNKVLSCLFSAVFISSSPILGLFTQPYLATSNALAILLSSLSFKIFVNEQKRIKQVLFGIVMLVLSLSIYQAYITFEASFMVVYLIKQLLIDDKSAKETFKSALAMFALLLSSLALYGLVTLVINKILEVELLSYAGSTASILRRFRVAYTAFAGYFIKGYYSIIPSYMSLAANVLLFILSAVSFFKIVLKKGRAEIALSLVLAVMLPLAVNSMYLAASPDVFSAIVFLGFTSLYMLCAVLFNDGNVKVRGCVLTFLTLIAIGNIYFTNMVSLKMYMQTSQTKAFYEGVMSRVTSLEEYETGDEIAIIGEEKDQSYIFDEIDTTNYIGLTAEDPYNIYTKERFIELYLGYKGPFADFYRKCLLMETDDYKNMPQYPEAGSVKEIDGTIVVKLG